MGVIEVLTIVFIVFKLAGIGACAKWDIIAWPWHWSCLCLEMWIFIAYIAIAIIFTFLKGVSKR